jgi:hypothetical protein
MCAYIRRRRSQQISSQIGPTPKEHSGRRSFTGMVLILILVVAHAKKNARGVFVIHLFPSANICHKFASFLHVCNVLGLYGRYAPRACLISFNHASCHEASAKVRQAHKLSQLQTCDMAQQNAHSYHSDDRHLLNTITHCQAAPGRAKSHEARKRHRKHTCTCRKNSWRRKRDQSSCADVACPAQTGILCCLVHNVIRYAKS